MTQPLNLDGMVDRAAFFSHEHQLHLVDVADGFVIIAVTRIAAPIRRRVLALLTPALVFFAVISLFFQGYGTFSVYDSSAYDSSVYYLSPGTLVPEQWAVLVGAPVVAFLAA
jgi:hypothetical protein